jgi:hypothetical protein
MKELRPSVAVGVLPYWLALASVLVLWALQNWQAQLPPDIYASTAEMLSGFPIELASNHVSAGPEALLSAGLVTFLVAQAVLQRQGRVVTALGWKGWMVFVLAQGALQFTPPLIAGWAAGPGLLGGNLLLLRVVDLLVQGGVAWAALRLALRMPGVLRGQDKDGMVVTGHRAALVFGAFSLAWLSTLWLLVLMHYQGHWAYLDPSDVIMRALRMVAYLVAVGVACGLGAWQGLKANAPVRMRRLMLLSLLALLLGAALRVAATITSRSLLPNEMLVGTGPELGFDVVMLAVQAGVALLLTRRWG